MAEYLIFFSVGYTYGNNYGNNLLKLGYEAYKLWLHGRPLISGTTPRKWVASTCINRQVSSSRGSDKFLSKKKVYKANKLDIIRRAAWIH